MRTAAITVRSQAELLAVSLADTLARAERVIALYGAPQQACPSDADTPEEGAYAYKKALAKATGCASVGGSITDYVARNQGTVWAALREIAEQDAATSGRAYRGTCAASTDVRIWRWLAEVVDGHETRYQVLRAAQARTDYAAMRVLAEMWGLTCDEIEELAYVNYGRCRK